MKSDLRHTRLVTTARLNFEILTDLDLLPYVPMFVTSNPHRIG